MVDPIPHITKLTAAEQEYLKHICLCPVMPDGLVHTRELAKQVETRPASVTDMVRKLAQKKLIDYKKGHGFNLTEAGKQKALQVIRRHRLWELFLSDKLGIDWKDVHEIANQLQSIDTELLISHLSAYLGFPVYDPHGELIPDASGEMPSSERMDMYDLKVNQVAGVEGYRDSTKAFLAYMEKLKLLIGNKIKIVSLIAYDQSLEIEVNHTDRFIISKDTAQKIYIHIYETT